MRIETEDADAVYDTYHFGNQSSISVGDVSDPEEEDARGLNSCWHGNFAVYENVDFHDAVYSASVRKNYVRGSKMEMWIDPEIDAESKSFTGGTLVGTVEYPKPEKDDWSRWQTFEMPVEGAPSGVHTVVLRFLAGGGSAENQNYGSINYVELNALKKKSQSGVCNVLATETGMKAVGGCGSIVVEGEHGVSVTVYAVDGRLIRSFVMADDHERVDGLASGIYIVNGLKVAVR